MKRKQAIYKVTYYKKHYLHKKFIAGSVEEATSLAWANCPKECWIEKVEV